MFTLIIETGNEAFDDQAKARDELARILRTVAVRLEAGIIEGHTRDINGNRVGTFLFEPDTQEEE